MSKVFVGMLLGALAGLVGTFLLMFAFAALLDAIFGGPGYGAVVFYLSFVLSPVAGVVGGLLGARIGKRAAPSDTNKTPTDDAAVSK